MEGIRVDKAERLYRYVDECFSVDVMGSIFLENYEFTNQALFYSQLLGKYETFGRGMNDSTSDENFNKIILKLRETLDKRIREYMLGQFITYCSKVINRKYIEGKTLNLDNAALKEQSIFYCEEKLVCELENDILDIQNKEEISAVGFIKKATDLLREKEEKVYMQFK